ncbi:unnamed protein product [Prorocentrum cordatum]|uniref:Uncharacterized protein n=1 Tax=Prorocentrum cordatum TaxID=2364126 RepID=A0ABN9TNS1_9DINO|nr:unnamed protein product [Polarella glacialis]
MRSLPAARLAVPIAALARQCQVAVAKRVAELAVPERGPDRVISEKACTLAEHWVVMDYKDGGGESRAGTFVHASSASWNGVLLLTKSYNDGKCLVSYRTTCAGTSVYLDLDDTCGWRTARRKFTSPVRQTKLHKNSFLFRSADTAITVFLAGGRALELRENGAKVTFTLVDPSEDTGRMTGTSDFRYFINTLGSICALPPTQPSQTLCQWALGWSTALRSAPRVASSSRVPSGPPRPMPTHSPA